jgi:hypothetical protein
MTEQASTPTHLLIYGFAPGAEFEGRLDDAVSRTGGKPLASELVDPTAFAERTAALLTEAVRGEKLG